MTDIVPEKNEMHLPFVHGIEVELQVIKKDGSWIRGEEILSIFDKLISNAKTLLDKRIQTAWVESVKRKYKHSSQTEEGERGSRVVALYDNPKGKPTEFTLLGHDPNVTSLTWILEIATPPCTSIEELAWWIQTLIAISYESLPKEARAILISTGLNPAQEYLKNLSFGEHHHILGPDVDDQVRLAVYNMFRNFIPHLIALSVNSPFENKKPTDIVEIDEDGKTRAPRCKRSIRLVKNTTQLGPTNEFEFIPYMVQPDKEAFARHVNRSYARMVDMYPFHRLGTVELRVFDTQLSIPRRVGIALLLQALALKAKRMVEQGEKIPDAGAKALAANRASAVSAGLWGPFRSGSETDNPEFMRLYNYKVDDDGETDDRRRNRFMGDAVVSMLYLIRDELEELDVVDNPFMQPILVSVFGSEVVPPRTTGADFQLDVYAKSDMNMVVLLKSLADITRECCTNWVYDPLEGTPKLPTWLCWWTGLEPEILTDIEQLFAGQEADFIVSLRNTGDRPLFNLGVDFTIEDSDRNVVHEGVRVVPEIISGQIHSEQITFQTNKEVTAYNIIVTIGLAGKQIHLTGTLNTYWMKANIRPGTTTQFSDGKTPVLYKGDIETNFPESTDVTVDIAVIAPGKERVLAIVTDKLRVESLDTLLFDQASLPDLIVPTDASHGVERCILRLNLVDAEDELIASVTSKPFYIGFARKGPQLLFDADLKGVYYPGDLIVGEIELASKKHSMSKKAFLVVEFRSDSGEHVEIARFGLKEVTEAPVRFTWRVPPIESEELSHRAGVIVSSLVDKGKEVASTETSRFRIDRLGVLLNIDSLRAPDSAHIGGKISGWLRVRRNTELGGPAGLVVALKFPDEEEHVLVEQRVKQSRNLSLAFGPITIPQPKGKKKPSSVTLTAKLTFEGTVIDQRSTEIALSDGPEGQIASASFAGVPAYVLPDEEIRPVLQVTNITGKKLKYDIKIELESVGGTDTLVKSSRTMQPGQSKILPIQLRVPLSAEMSTAHLKAIVKCGRLTMERKERFKVKAIESPVFDVDFWIRKRSGEEIPGLVARLTKVELGAKICGLKEGMTDLGVILRVMSRREIVKQFQASLSDPETGEKEITFQWTTPPVDMVTGYYLDAVITQDGKTLPDRAVRQDRKQFTVY
jgi:hypothetical protein